MDAKCGEAFANLVEGPPFLTQLKGCQPVPLVQSYAYEMVGGQAIAKTNAGVEGGLVVEEFE